MLSYFSRVHLFATLGTIGAMADQAPLSMGFSRQEYWSGLPMMLAISHIRMILARWVWAGFAWKVKVLLSRLCLTLWDPWRTIARHAPLSIGFSRQEYWSGLPVPSPGKCYRPRDRTRVSRIAGRLFIVWATVWGFQKKKNSICDINRISSRLLRVIAQYRTVGGNKGMPKVQTGNVVTHLLSQEGFPRMTWYWVLLAVFLYILAHRGQCSEDRAWRCLALMCVPADPTNHVAFMRVSDKKWGMPTEFHRTGTCPKAPSRRACVTIAGECGFSWIKQGHASNMGPWS